jgi:hypothetical protein
MGGLDTDFTFDDHVRRYDQPIGDDVVSYDPRPETISPAPAVSGLAIAGLVLGVLGLCLGILAPIGAVLGHVANAQILRGKRRGLGLAIAAVAVGWAITAVWIGLATLSPQGVLDIYKGIGDLFEGIGDFFVALVS